MWLAGLAGTSAAAGLLAYVVRGRSARLLAPSVHHGSPVRPALALTFDDGPSESTPDLLSLLARHHAVATFFQVGANVRRLPEIAREVASAGHEVGNHTDTHPRLDFRSPAFILDELSRAQDTIRLHAGRAPTLFRAPYGVRWFGLRAAQERLRLLGVMWTVIGRDWRLPADAIARRVLSAARNGAIVCLHDGRELRARPDMRPTLEAVARLLPALQDAGYRFETVSQLLCPTP